MNKFCSALFNAIRKDNDFRIRPCCVFRPKKSIYELDQWLESDYLKGLKQSLLEGIEVPECNQCWLKEKNGFTSLRHIYNQHLLHVSEVPDSLARKAQSNLVYADIKIGNTCNYSCVMCHPGDSSRIYSEWIKHPENDFVYDYLKNNHELINPKHFENQRIQSLKFLNKILDYPSVRSIKLLGGEPLLQQDFLKILSDVPDYKKSKITLNFVTNGSVDFIDTCNYLGNYKSINLVLSLEGIEHLQEYIRKYSNWTRISDNVDRFLKHRKSNCNLSVHHTIQALSLGGLSDLVQWCYNHNLKLSFQILTSPDYLAVSVLNPDYVSKKISLIKSSMVKEVLMIDDDNVSLSDVKNYVSCGEYRHDLRPKFLDYIDFYEKTHKLKLINVAPDLLDSLD